MLRSVGTCPPVPDKDLVRSGGVYSARFKGQGVKTAPNGLSDNA
ncbi:hypothetical protein [Stygiolobus caldivivus]|nr:hypothetical protein [Stygiolobus caldivivus]